MRNFLILVVAVFVLQGCATTKENVTPTIPKPPVVFSQNN